MRQRVAQYPNHSTSTAPLQPQHPNHSTPTASPRPPPHVRISREPQHPNQDPPPQVRISRQRVLDSAIRVMELYSGQKALLEVEYFGEVGTGLGPTLEFYSLVSHELRKVSRAPALATTAMGTQPPPPHPALSSRTSWSR
jgi:hypothetical protein